MPAAHTRNFHRAGSGPQYQKNIELRCNMSLEDWLGLCCRADEEWTMEWAALRGHAQRAGASGLRRQTALYLEG